MDDMQHKLEHNALVAEAEAGWARAVYLDYVGRCGDGRRVRKSADLCYRKAFRMANPGLRLPANFASAEYVYA